MLGFLTWGAVWPYNEPLSYTSFHLYLLPFLSLRAKWMTTWCFCALLRVFQETQVAGIRRMEKRDVGQLTKLLLHQLSKYSLAPQFSEEEVLWCILIEFSLSMAAPAQNKKPTEYVLFFFCLLQVAHWLMPRDKVIYTWVVEVHSFVPTIHIPTKLCFRATFGSECSLYAGCGVCVCVQEKGSGKITDMISFYSLPSSIIGNETYKTLHAAYSYYNVSTKTPLKVLSVCLSVCLSLSLPPSPIIITVIHWELQQLCWSFIHHSSLSIRVFRSWSMMPWYWPTNLALMSTIALTSWKTHLSSTISNLALVMATLCVPPPSLFFLLLSILSYLLLFLLC